MEYRTPDLSPSALNRVCARRLRVHLPVRTLLATPIPGGAKRRASETRLSQTDPLSPQSPVCNQAGPSVVSPVCTARPLNIGRRNALVDPSSRLHALIAALVITPLSGVANANSPRLETTSTSDVQPMNELPQQPLRQRRRKLPVTLPVSRPPAVSWSIDLPTGQMLPLVLTGKRLPLDSPRRTPYRYGFQDSPRQPHPDQTGVLDWLPRKRPQLPPPYPALLPGSVWNM